MPASCNLIANWFCDHPRRLRNLRTCGPMMLRCLMSARAAWALVRGEMPTPQPLCVEEGRICDEAGFFDASSQKVRLFAKRAASGKKLDAPRGPGALAESFNADGDFVAYSVTTFLSAGRWMIIYSDENRSYCEISRLPKPKEPSAHEPGYSSLPARVLRCRRLSFAIPLPFPIL